MATFKYPTLADKRKKFPPPTKEAFNKAFAGTKSVEVGESDGGSFAIDDVVCIKESDDGLLIHSPSSAFRNAFGWVPRSQVLPESKVKALNDEGQLLVTMWLARQRGWTT